MWKCNKCDKHWIDNVPGVNREPQDCDCREFDIMDEAGDGYKQWAVNHYCAAIKFANSGEFHLVNNTMKIFVYDNNSKLETYEIGANINI